MNLEEQYKKEKGRNAVDEYGCYKEAFTDWLIDLCAYQSRRIEAAEDVIDAAESYAVTIDNCFPQTESFPNRKIFDDVLKVYQSIVEEGKHE